MAKSKFNADPDFRSWINDTVADLLGETTSTVYQEANPPVPHSSTHHPKRPARLGGVYALYLGAQLVYIGRSGNIYSRIAAHMSLGVIVFDTFEFDVCDHDTSIALEAKLINQFQPHYNKHIPILAVEIK